MFLLCTMADLGIASRGVLVVSEIGARASAWLECASPGCRQRKFSPLMSVARATVPRTPLHGLVIFLSPFMVESARHGWCHHGVDCESGHRLRVFKLPETKGRHMGCVEERQ